MSTIESHTEELSLGPQQRIDLVATLVSRPGLWTEWFAEHPDRSAVFAHAFRLVVRLEQVTNWETDVLLRQLGCGKETTDQLSRMGTEELQRCSDYFQWVEDLVGRVFTVIERRDVLSRAWLFYRDVQGDLVECERAMRAGSFSALELLSLGEIEKAWLVAQMNIAGPIGDRARRLVRANPFLELHPHLGPATLDRYLDPRSRRLNPKGTAVIADHLAICAECRDALETRSVERGISDSVSSVAPTTQVA